jgi:hypothetical protein
VYDTVMPLRPATFELLDQIERAMDALARFVLQ